MDPTPIQLIAGACGGKLLRGDGNRAVDCISKDSRTIAPGSLYWALQGENHDGHDFASAAAAAGAAAAVVGREPAGWPAHLPLVLVDDTQDALTRLAAWHRDRLHARVICITGSNGKTSTKDFTASVAATRFAVNKTEGNLNNHLGLPLTILTAKTTDEVAVWEIGMNHEGEIAALARLARPDIGIITNVGVAHIEFLGSREAIAREKGALAEALGPDAVLAMPCDDDFTATICARTKARVVLAGADGRLSAESLRPAANGLDFELVSGKERVAAHLPVFGEHMVRNALLAVAAGLELGLSLRECASGLASTKLSARRLACLDVRGVTVLDDSYNANPDSMEAALHALRGLPGGGKRFAVLGRMGELGSYAEEGYRRVGRTAAGTIDILIAVGPETGVMAEEAESAGAREVRRASDTSEAARLLRDLARPGDAVVIKGSRAARMERVLEEFS
ncbi:MAG: UDP-N-acetylmuramoyl-tripeptide--D-alanyl-D-alanine ligase [Chthoniobacterales bacterium]|nr:UDP-N-acetylmuramoyl-tripeptide--D-alanyl-D-alanine ligase [Chthoniobacterales bacterium]